MEGSGWGTRVYLWQIHVDIWQNQNNIVKLKKDKKDSVIKKIKKKSTKQTLKWYRIMHINNYLKGKCIINKHTKQRT